MATTTLTCTSPLPEYLNAGKYQNEIHRLIKEFEAETKPFFQNKLGRHNLLRHHRCALLWLRSHEYFHMVKCDKKIGTAIIEHDVGATLK